MKNISLKLFREYLKFKGLNIIRINGGHEIWGGKQLKRPIVLQTHVDPIPEFIIRNKLRTLGTDKKDFDDFVKEQ